jgi:hypothetical protein
MTSGFFEFEERAASRNSGLIFSLAAMDLMEMG